MQKIRIGVVGLGDISHVYLTNLQKYSDYVTIDACASRSLEKAQYKADQYGIPHAYASAEQLIREADVDLILNLTTPDMHYPLNKLALECGKHVYTEKPLAFTYAQGKELLELAASKQLRIGCAPDTFLGARLQTCRDLLDAGTIGEVIGASAFVIYHGGETFHPNPAFFYHEGAGPLMDIGPYYMTALLSLLGPVQSCCAMSKRTFDQRPITSEPRRGEIINVEVDTYTTGLMQFASGAIGTAIFSFDVWDSNLPRIEIYGTKGTLCLPDIDPLDGPNIFGGDILLRTEENYRWYQQPRDWFDVKKDWIHVPVTRPFASTSHAENSRGIGLVDIALAIAEDRPERASGAMALHSLEVMEKMLSGAKTRQFGIMETTFERPAPLPDDFPVR